MELENSNLAKLLQQFDVGYIGDGYYHATVDELHSMANKLSRVARHDPPWTWRYLRNILNGKLQPSFEFDQAVEKLTEMSNGDGIKLGKVMTVVWANKGIPQETVVFGDARQCKTPACKIWFIPKIWNQKYCCQECKRYGADWLRREI